VLLLRAHQITFLGYSYMERIILMAGINIKYPLATAIRENRYIGQLLPLLPPSHIVIPNSSGQKKPRSAAGSI
jgi:hypothetical protein